MGCTRDGPFVQTSPTNTDKRFLAIKDKINRNPIHSNVIYAYAVETTESDIIRFSTMASRSPSSSPDSATGSGTDPARPDTGEPLGGGSDSDSDLGLGKFDCGVDDPGHRLEGEELEHEFEAAADRLRDLVQTASREQLLYLYARYKQVTIR